MRFDRIAVDHLVMGGTPRIVGTRIPVSTIVSLVAEGQTPEAVVADFTQLTVDDVRQALQFAAEAVRVRSLPIS